MGLVELVLPLLTLLPAQASAGHSPGGGEDRLELVHRLAGTVCAVMPLNRRGGGSGVIIDPEGTVLTNFHVVASALDPKLGKKRGVMKVGTRDGRLRRARVIGLDPGGDLALLRLERGADEKPGPFPWAPLGSQEELRVGSFALAMGNPFLLATDFSPTVTMGIVSGLHRYLPGRRGKLVYPDCVQTDARINPGNSGGPLFDMKGRIIGINGRISVGQRGRVNVGLGFAISADQARLFIPDMRAGRLCHHGSLLLDARDYEGELVVAAIQEKGPAWNAGIRHGDILLELDGDPLAGQNDLLQRIARLPAGWWVRLAWRERKGGRREERLRLVPAVPPDKKLQGWEPAGLDELLRRERHRLEAMARRALGAKGGTVPVVARTFSRPDRAAALDPPRAILPALGALHPPFPKAAEFDGGDRVMGRAVCVLLLPGKRGERLFLDPDSGLPLGTGWSPDPTESEVRLVVTAWQESPAGRWPRRVSWRREGRELLVEEIEVKGRRQSL